MTSADIFIEKKVVLRVEILKKTCERSYHWYIIFEYCWTQYHRHFFFADVLKERFITIPYLQTTKNMVEDEEGEIDLEELTSEVPWEFVYDFLPLRSILACRASCTVHTEKCNFVSPEKCVDLLIRAMKQRNIHPAWHLGNENSGGCSSANDDEALRSLLQKWLHVDENKSTAFDILLRCFRVFQFLPEEALIICPEEGDINCMPFDFADGAPKLANSPLPPNLLCPLCRSRCSNGSSTLAFIHLSYNSCVPIMSNRAHISLTYTPGEEEVSDKESLSNGCQEESAGNGPIL